MNRLSKIFQPINKLPKDALLKHNEITSKSQKLMLDLGVIRLANPGCFYFLPLGMRALEKLKSIIDTEMYKIGAQKLMLPTLTNALLWEKSGRLKNATELFTLNDRHKNAYILSPTNEEDITNLLASIGPLSYKNFPLFLYQISSKYRDELRTRFGLLRARQFIMKDLYTFDIDSDAAKVTYETVCKSYQRILGDIGIDFIDVYGATGDIGGDYSHEFHYLANIGEDKLLVCLQCGYKGNSEITGTEICLKCKSKNVEIKHGIEIGHTFMLGDKYSKALNATYLTKNGKPEYLQMGCYGLGVSRLLGAALEVLSLEQELRWPSMLVPYKILIIPPKDGSKEAKVTGNIEEELYNTLNTLSNYRNDVIIDDRKHMTIGKRFLEARQVGYPYVIAIGKTATQNPPLYEVNDINTNKQYLFDKNELFTYFKDLNNNAV